MDFTTQTINSVQSVSDTPLKEILLNGVPSINTDVSNTFCLTIHSHFGENEFKSVYDNFNSRTEKKIMNLKWCSYYFPPDLEFKNINKDEKRISGGPNVNGETRVLSVIGLVLYNKKTSKKVTMQFNSKDDEIPKPFLSIDNATIIHMMINNSHGPKDSNKGIYHHRSDLILGEEEELGLFAWSSNNPEDWINPWELQKRFPHYLNFFSFKSK